MQDYKNRTTAFNRSTCVLGMTEDEFNAYPAESRGYTWNALWVLRHDTVFDVKLISQRVKPTLAVRSPAP